MLFVLLPQVNALVAPLLFSYAASVGKVRQPAVVEDSAGFAV